MSGSNGAGSGGAGSNGAASGAGPWTRARAAWLRAGARGVWFGACAETCYRRLLLLDRMLDAPPPVLPSPPGLRVVRLDDARAYRAFRPDTSDEAFRSRRAGGAECFAAVLGDRIVGATWARPGGGPARYLKRAIELDACDVFLFDTFVLPELRGRRIAPAIAVAQIALFGAAGFRRIVSTVLPENRTSLRARSRTGFAIYGLAGYVGVGPWRFDFERRYRTRRELSS